MSDDLSGRTHYEVSVVLSMFKHAKEALLYASAALDAELAFADCYTAACATLDIPVIIADTKEIKEFAASLNLECRPCKIFNNVTVYKRKEKSHGHDVYLRPSKEHPLCKD